MTTSVVYRVLEPRPGARFEIAVDAESNDPIGLRIGDGQYAYPEALALALELVRPGARVLDLGAHVGTFALAAAALRGRVVAVDANLANVALLRASASRNEYADLHVVHSAVGAAEGEVSFLSAGPFGHIVEAHAQADGVTRVPSITIDGCLDRLGWDGVDVVKMDVEGAELAALQGMRRLLSGDDAPFLVFEANGHALNKLAKTPNQLLAALEEHGYRCWLIRSGQLVPVASGDLQAECNVDYVASKRALPEFGSWRLSPPFTAAEILDQTLAAIAHPGEHERAYTLRALAEAPAFVRDDERVRRALSALDETSRPGSAGAPLAPPTSQAHVGAAGGELDRVEKSKVDAPPTALAPFDLLVAWLIILGVLGVGLVAIRAFEPWLVLVLGSGLTVAAIAASRLPICWRDARLGGALLVIVLLGLLVRVPPYPHPNGGQDPGLYVSLSHAFENHGGYLLDDPLQARLSFDQAKLYGDGYGFVVPGVTGSPAGFVITFYPLHPVYMSLAASTLGSGLRVASLTLFAILGLLSLSLLATELTGSRYAGLLVAAFVAAHPGLAFFSKFPVAEIVALAFSATSAYYLARFVRLAQRGAVEPVWLLLATGCFLCTCLARPMGLFFLPTLAVTVVALLVSELSSLARKSILLFWLAAVVSVALSYALLFQSWGEVFSGLAIGRALGHGFGQRPLLEVAVVSVGSAILLGMVGRGRDRRRDLGRFVERWHVPAVVALWAFVIAFLVWRAWMYLPERDSLVRGVFLLQPGVEGAIRLLPYRLMAHLSPIGVVLVALAPFLWPKVCRGGTSLLFLLVGTMTFAYAGGTLYLPYSYYHDRYASGEIVPYGLVLLAIVLDELRRRRRTLADAAAVLVIAYFALFTLFQVGKREGADPELFERLRATRDEEALYFLDLDSVRRPQAIATALRFDLDLMVFPIASQFGLTREPLSDLRAYPAAYVLSGRREPIHSFLELEHVFEFRESFLHDGNGHMLERLHWLRPQGSLTTSGADSWWNRYLLPLRYSVISQPLFLYRVDTEALASRHFHTAARLESEQLFSGWNDPRLRFADPWRASEGAARVARPEIMAWPHGHRALVHGPYHYQSAGAYRAAFRLRYAGEAGDDGGRIVAGIDVAAEKGARVLASRCLTGRDFPESDRYETVVLPFESSEDLEALEYRVWYRGIGTLWSDFVELESVAGGAEPAASIETDLLGGDVCGE